MKTENKITIHFLGAAGTVTGSKYLIDTGAHKILIDCGLFQGLKELRLKNWDYFPVDVTEIDTVLLTHGHMDHTGYLPRLVKMGFKGSIRGTAPTLAVAEIIILDSAKIQEEYAAQANKEGFSKHSPAEPLYTVKDAEKTVEHFHTIQEEEWLELFPEIKVRFQYNGHIIGACFIEMDIYGKRYVFSGDIGRKKDVLMHEPHQPEKADVLFIESTYGNRIHPDDDLEEKLAAVVNATIEKGGTLIIPSFAVERTQTLMYLLWQLRVKNRIPAVDMVMDSPMGKNVLEVFRQYENWHKLPDDDGAKMCEAFHIVEAYKETWEVIDNKEPKIIIAGSGMISGGRVLTYLQYYVGLPETTVLLAGFQAEGTRGRKLLEGATEIKINGKMYPVKARIENLEVLSAHADQPELLEWLNKIKNTPEKIFIVHGEVEAAKTLGEKIKDVYGWKSEVPELYSIHTIDK